MTATRLTTVDGEQLEAAWSVPDDPHAALVLCHPHPRHGGTMSAPLIEAVARSLLQDGWAVLRFNFRGIGASTGTWGGGVAEISDVAAAVDAAGAAFPGLTLGLAGWSFGAATALRWQARTRSALPFVGIAPPVTSNLTPVLPDPERLAPAPRTFVLGDRDQFIAVGDLEAYAAAVGAGLEVIEGSDHFFHFREAQVAALVAEGLRPRG